MTNKTKMLHLLRHGESEFNLDSTCLLRDCGLTEKGQQQAAQLHGQYDLIFCSPLRRCRETLVASQLKGQVEICYLCREHLVDVCDYFPGELRLGEDDTLYQLRVEEFRRLLQEHRTKRILVISHGDFLFQLTSHMVNGEIFGQWLANAEIIEWPI